MKRRKILKVQGTEYKESKKHGADAYEVIKIVVVWTTVSYGTLTRDGVNK